MQKFKEKLRHMLSTLPIVLFLMFLSELWDKGFNKSSWLTISMTIICGIYTVAYLIFDWFKDDDQD